MVKAYLQYGRCIAEVCLNGGACTNNSYTITRNDWLSSYFYEYISLVHFIRRPASQMIGFFLVTAHAKTII